MGSFKPPKNPLRIPPCEQHQYAANSKFVRTSAYDAFYRAVVMPILGKFFNLQRDQGYALYRIKLLRFMDALGDKIPAFVGPKRTVNMKSMADCPVPGCFKWPAGLWPCWNCYFCPSCYGRDVVKAYDRLVVAMKSPESEGQELFVARQEFEWPKKLDGNEMSEYLTAYVDAVRLYVQRIQPIDGPKPKISDIEIVPISGVARMYVWFEKDTKANKRVRFSFVGLRPKIPDGWELMEKWPMPRKLKRLCKQPPRIFTGRPGRRNLVRSIVLGFKYPAKLMDLRPRPVLNNAIIIDRLTGRGIKLSRYVGLATKQAYDAAKAAKKQDVVRP